MTSLRQQMKTAYKFRTAVQLYQKTGSWPEGASPANIRAWVSLRDKRYNNGTLTRPLLDRGARRLKEMFSGQ